MAVKTIPLSRLEMDLKKTLNDCAESGQTVVVELPDQRLLAIQPLDAKEDNEQVLALILRAKWMRVMGASEDEISECCDPAFYSPDLDEELDNILTLREIRANNLSREELSGLLRKRDRSQTVRS